MPNKQKARGDQWEREDLAWWRSHGFPHAERTRPGRREDQGDIHPVPGVLIQNKWSKFHEETKWLDQVHEQMRNANFAVGIIRIKRSRPGGKPPLIYDIVPVEVTEHLLRAAGYGTPLEG